MMRTLAVVISFAFSIPAYGQESHADTAPSLAPDIRKDDTRLKIQDGNFVAVPIPMANPTLDAGLVAGAAYFYPQTAEQKKQQPASVTGSAAMYTSNDSWALAGFHQAYWDNDKWRLTGVIGAADLRLSLISPEDSESRDSADWRVDGAFLNARLARRLSGDWYGGGLVRYVDSKQSIEFQSGQEPANFDLDFDITAVGVGFVVEYDTRDMPTGPYSGRQFKAEGLFNAQAIGSDKDYRTLTLDFKSYHELNDSLVLAWELRGCQKGGSIPLWDACRIPLRGFSAFDYLGQSSASGQAEVRWRAYKRLGLVAFSGLGWAGKSFSTAGDDESTPSYGAGIRYEVLPAKRLNMRLDFAWSEDSEGIYLSVGEAF
ncbi:MAG: outer membrane protein assembly factor [Gammaproteobacteria bacterium]|nr:outer membrane protein assembly factor [Gammaproteobacteria bacterium]